MKIENIKINAYGNLKNKDIELNKFNIIYGKNESGKSTLLNYIKNSFYGISKNKNGREISDYDKYLPWNEKEFSGRIKYKLDNNNSYEIYRDFNKKNAIIYNDQKEDISDNFKVDKKTGNQFFYDQTKVDENTFMATAISMQKEVIVDNTTQGILLQKVANLAESGVEDVSYKKAISNINSRLLNEVGTTNSKERPINIARENIKKYEIDMQTINETKNNRYKIEENIKEKSRELEEEKEKEKLLNKISEILEDQKSEEEKIKLKNNIINENLEKIKNLDNKKDNLINQIKKEEKVPEKKSLNKINILIIFLLILINILDFIFIHNLIINISLILLLPIYIIYLLIKNNKNKKELNKFKEINNKIIAENDEIKNQMSVIDGQIELLENSNENTKKEIENSKIELNNNLKNNKEKIINDFNGIYDQEYISNLFNNNIDLLKNTNKRKLNEIELELHKLKLDRNNIDPELEKLIHTEELLEIEEENLTKLEKRAKEFELAKELLDEAYEEMRSNITPKFNQTLSKNIDIISNGKYKNISINDKITIELNDGRYISAESLSIGTVEQIYLSLRLSILNEISNEKLPIILDEAFAYYDDNRLEAALEFLSKVDNQVILFTCTNREKEILDKNNINYNYILL